ncbi:hypothetical protein BT63DRAFT_467625 [Microthyrium microscopicum]|uniref:Uncharacterized protein n=1 Tax=Microthyrium microscopicum TaxID=703497 RepID=A0A6A6UNX5_9PEZI|nr:hypothetical protein BT63DRAFT_467625 [Microthyrium microscopicum]
MSVAKDKIHIVASSILSNGPSKSIAAPPLRRDAMTQDKTPSNRCNFTPVANSHPSRLHIFIFVTNSYTHTPCDFKTAASPWLLRVHAPCDFNPLHLHTRRDFIHPPPLRFDAWCEFAYCAFKPSHQPRVQASHDFIDAGRKFHIHHDIATHRDFHTDPPRFDTHCDWTPVASSTPLRHDTLMPAVASPDCPRVQTVRESTRSANLYPPRAQTVREFLDEDFVHPHTLRIHGRCNFTPVATFIRICRDFTFNEISKPIATCTP